MSESVDQSSGARTSGRAGRATGRDPWRLGLALLLLAGLVAAWLLGGGPPPPVAAGERMALRPEGSLPPVRRDERLPDPGQRGPPDDALAPLAAGVAPVEPVVPEDAVPPAALSGRVIDQDGTTVPDVAVDLYRGQEKRSARTGAQGWFRFEGLGSGLYRLYVDPRSLPAGLLPPWRQQVAREPEQDPSGVYGAAVRLTAGAERSVDLRVFAAGSVRGRVLGRDAAPLPGALVTLRASSGLFEEARTDADGRFAVDRVRAGAYTAFLTRDASAALDDGSLPLPLPFDLAPGQALDLPDLVAGRGGHVLAGSVVDRDGRPVVGIAVVCRAEASGPAGPLAATTTDEAGRFRLGRVPSAALVVAVEPEPSAPVGASAVTGSASASLRVDTRGRPERQDVGVLLIDAPHPFRLVGRVDVDPTWARDHGFLRWDARVAVRGAQDRAEGAPGAGAVEPSEPPVGSAGRFDWTCATPHPEIELIVIVKGTQGAEIERRARVLPVPDETRELVVTIP